MTEQKIKKYYACTWNKEIKNRFVERESDKCIWSKYRWGEYDDDIKESRELKISDSGCYFDTWEEAKEFLLKKAEAKVQSARRALECANSEYGNIKGLKK